MELGPSGHNLTRRRCEWCDRPSPWAICLVCRGAPEPRETFANFLPVGAAVTKKEARTLRPPSRTDT